MSESVKLGLGIGWLIFAVCTHFAGEDDSSRLGIICSAIFLASL